MLTMGLAFFKKLLLVNMFGMNTLQLSIERIFFESSVRADVMNFDPDTNGHHLSKMKVAIFFLSSLFLCVDCSKYDKYSNLDRPFTISKVNQVWQKAQKVNKKKTHSIEFPLILLISIETAEVIKLPTCGWELDDLRSFNRNYDLMRHNVSNFIGSWTIKSAIPLHYCSL